MANCRRLHGLSGSEQDGSQRGSARSPGKSSRCRGAAVYLTLAIPGQPPPARLRTKRHTGNFSGARQAVRFIVLGHVIRRPRHVFGAHLHARHVRIDSRAVRPVCAHGADISRRILCPSPPLLRQGLPRSVPRDARHWQGDGVPGPPHARDDEFRREQGAGAGAARHGGQVPPGRGRGDARHLSLPAWKHDARGAPSLVGDRGRAERGRRASAG